MFTSDNIIVTLRQTQRSSCKQTTVKVNVLQAVQLVLQEVKTNSSIVACILKEARVQYTAFLHSYLENKMKITNRSHAFILPTTILQLLSVQFKKQNLTRKSSCVNARGIPPARVAIAISCYSGGGGSLDKKKISQSEHVSSQIWCQKFFPLLRGGGGPLTKIFFSSLNMYQTKSGVKNFSLYWGRGGGWPSTKIFFPV